MGRTCIVVSHTHWDREWYEPYQRFRMRLVHLMDKLLDILDRDPEYKYFMLDGQTIVLGDYLEVRPEREPALRRHVRSGRLLIGPWHILPDEFLVSGEAIIRNLLLGDRIAQDVGGKMMVGYIPDPFGHISQMPQILRGLDMDCAAVMRGLDDQPSELLWRSPDGSEVLTCYMRKGYGNAAHLPVRDEEAFAGEIARQCEALTPFATTDYRLLMNGTDHTEPMPELPQALAAAAKRLPDIELVHGTLPMYIDAVKKSLNWDASGTAGGAPGELVTVRGELRSCKRHPLLPGVLSARMWIKQRNHQVQNLLEKWTEPFAALAALARRDAHPFDKPDAAYALVWRAWKYLLENQPHDSICGCSVDQTHREMVTRFDWAQQIAEEVARQSLTSLAGQIDTQRQQPSTPCIPLVVFNPLVATRTDVVTASLQVPGSLDHFAVVDSQGRHVAHQVLTRKGAEFASLELDREDVLGLKNMVDMLSVIGLGVHEIHVTQRGDKGHIDVTLIEHGQTDPVMMAAAQKEIEDLLRASSVQIFAVRAHLATTVEFSFAAEGVPGCGYKTYFLVEGQDQVSAAAQDRGLRLENTFFSVDIDPEQGSVTLVVKSSGTRYPALHRFVDGGDRGDEYNYCPPEVDRLISAPSSRPEITWLEQGPVRWTVQVRQDYELPSALTGDRLARSEETVHVPITSQISLCQGAPRVDVRTVVENLASDHRLRVHFPAPVKTDASDAEGAFDVLKRPLGVPGSTSDWVEQPAPTHPQKTFVDVSDGRAGLMVANRGLPEYEVVREPDGSVTIALTLLRCVGWLSRDDYPCRKGHAGPALEAPEAQCTGSYAFEYSIIPHVGTWQTAYAQAHAFNAPLWAVSTGEHEGSMPCEQSLVSLQGNGLVLSAVKAAEAGDGLVVRFYNTMREPALARLHTFVPARSAWLVNLAERKLRELGVDGSGQVVVEAGGLQVVTVKLAF